MSFRYDSERFYSCYSPRVLRHLLNNGFDTYKDEHNPEGFFLNIKNRKTCHVFLKTKEFCECLAEVSK